MTSNFALRTMILACTSVAAFSFAQVNISGKVLYKNKPVKDVNVSLKDSYDGATTDAEGNYKFQTDEKGAKILVFSHPKYENSEQSINVESNDITINTNLKESLSEIDAVVITAGSIEASDKKRATALLTPLDIYTTAGADGQVTAALGYLPGVQKVGESEGLFVRGGTAGETKIFIDGTLVNNYFSQSTPGLSGRDRFNTSLFKGNVFSSGGYSAQYGQALSSVLLLESVDLPSKTSYDFSLSPLFAGANYQKLNEAKTASWGVSANYSNLGLVNGVFNANTDFSKSPNGFGSDANFRIKTKKGGFIKYYGNFQTGSMGVNNLSLEPNIDRSEVDLESNYTFQTLSYKEKFGKYKVNLSASYSFNQNNLDFTNVENGIASDTFAIYTKGNYVNAKSVVERKISKISVFRTGLEFNNSIEDSQFGSYKKHVTDLISSGFAETNLAVNRNFSLSLGARAEHSSYLDRWNLAPRVSMAYKISDTWVSSLAYGIYYQNPESKFINSNARLGFQKADHYIFQLQHNTDGRSLRLEAFYKDYSYLIKTVGSTSFQTAIDNSGNGFAKGMEIFWRDRKSIKGIDYWLTYSYLDTERNFMNFPTSLTPTFAAKHTLSAVAKKFVLNWKTGFNLSYTYASGRPYYDLTQDFNSSIRHQGYLKDYNALNFSVNYVPSIGRTDNKANTVIVLGINNILGTKNVFGYNYSQDGMRRSPVLPAYDTFVFIGAFISFGVDKTDDAINNNL
ncbi:carboxypeptidase-like regulatory domain-containing protein [Soonwooa sp.]|uniref:TonB-dependent receptor n=1 Tax=Soonwooa sp. TaxID=1938592 RepID=UPI0028B2376E|nr:carboxypeptidase-like regulatory domain-containing protein [Soonwooa sp.]